MNIKDSVYRIFTFFVINICIENCKPVCLFPIFNVHCGLRRWSSFLTPRTKSQKKTKKKPKQSTTDGIKNCSDKERHIQTNKSGSGMALVLETFCLSQWALLVVVEFWVIHHLRCLTLITPTVCCRYQTSLRSEIQKKRPWSSKVMQSSSKPWYAVINQYNIEQV